MARPPPGTLLTPRVREPRSNKQTCAGNISAGLTFRPTVGLTPILPGLRALSTPGGCLRPSGGCVVKYRANLRCSVPCGVVASVPLPCIQHDHWPNGNPPWPICPQFPLYPQVKVKKKVFRHAHNHPRISPERAPGDPHPNLDTPPPITPPKPLPYTIQQVTNGNDTPTLEAMNIYHDHREWLDNISPESSLTNAARRIDTTVGTLSRFLKRNGNKFDADYIIRIAIAYGINPAQALAETGLIPEESLTVRPPTAAEKRKLLTELLNEVDED